MYALPEERACGRGCLSLIGRFIDWYRISNELDRKLGHGAQTPISVWRCPVDRQKMSLN